MRIDEKIIEEASYFRCRFEDMNLSPWFYYDQKKMRKSCLIRKGRRDTNPMADIEAVDAIKTYQISPKINGEHVEIDWHKYVLKEVERIESRLKSQIEKFTTYLGCLDSVMSYTGHDDPNIDYIVVSTSTMHIKINKNDLYLNAEFMACCNIIEQEILTNNWFRAARKISEERKNYAGEKIDMAIDSLQKAKSHLENEE